MRTRKVFTFLVGAAAICSTLAPVWASNMYVIGAANFHKADGNTACTKTPMTGNYDNLEMWDCALGTGFSQLLTSYWPFPDTATNAWDVQVCFQTTDTSSCLVAFHLSLTAFPPGSDADAAPPTGGFIDEFGGASVHTVGTEYCTRAPSGSGSHSVKNALTGSTCTGTTECDHARVRMVLGYESGVGATCDDVQITKVRILYIAP